MSVEITFWAQNASTSAWSATAANSNLGDFCVLVNTPLDVKCSLSC